MITIALTGEQTPSVKITFFLLNPLEHLARWFILHVIHFSLFLLFWQRAARWYPEGGGSPENSATHVDYDFVYLSGTSQQRSNLPRWILAATSAQTITASLSLPDKIPSMALRCTYFWAGSYRRRGGKVASGCGCLETSKESDFPLDEYYCKCATVWWPGDSVTIVQTFNSFNNFKH